MMNILEKVAVWVLFVFFFLFYIKKKKKCLFVYSLPLIEDNTA